jgi:hypothetical protein
MGGDILRVRRWQGLCQQGCVGPSQAGGYRVKLMGGWALDERQACAVYVVLVWACIFQLEL